MRGQILEEIFGPAPNGLVDIWSEDLVSNECAACHSDNWIVGECGERICATCRPRRKP